MKVPRLTVRLTLETQLREPDRMGGYRTVWRDEGQLWAEMRSGAGGEHFAEVGMESVVSWRIKVRSATAGDPRRPRPGQRFRMGEGGRTRRFRIEAVLEGDPAGRWLICIAKEEMQA